MSYRRLWRTPEYGTTSMLQSVFLESWQSVLRSCSWASTNQYLTQAVRPSSNHTKFTYIELFVCLVDCGDYVVVSNARNIKVTGRKAEQIVYRHHTMYPGGLKEIKYKDMMERKPDEVCRGSSTSIEHSPTMARRLSGKLSPECFPRTSYESEGWNDCGYSKTMILVSSGKTSSSAGKMAPFLVNDHSPFLAQYYLTHA